MYLGRAICILMFLGSSLCNESFFTIIRLRFYAMSQATWCLLWRHLILCMLYVAIYALCCCTFATRNITYVFISHISYVLSSIEYRWSIVIAFLFNLLQHLLIHNVSSFFINHVFSYEVRMRLISFRHFDMVLGFDGTCLRIICCEDYYC